MEILKKPNANLLELFRCFPSDRLCKGIGMKRFAPVDHLAGIAEFQGAAEQSCNVDALVIQFLISFS